MRSQVKRKITTRFLKQLDTVICKSAISDWGNLLELKIELNIK